MSTTKFKFGIGIAAAALVAAGAPTALASYQGAPVDVTAVTCNEGELLLGATISSDGTYAGELFLGADMLPLPVGNLDPGAYVVTGYLDADGGKGPDADNSWTITVPGCSTPTPTPTTEPTPTPTTEPTPEPTPTPTTEPTHTPTPEVKKTAPVKKAPVATPAPVKVLKPTA